MVPFYYSCSLLSSLFLYGTRAEGYTRGRIGVDGLVVKIDMGAEGLQHLLLTHAAQWRASVNPDIPLPGFGSPARGLAYFWP